jgi:PAS domain S-box-containing protein
MPERNNNTQRPVKAVSTPSSSHARRTIEIETLFNSIGDGVVMTDEFGKVVRINPAGLNILGFTEKEMLGKWFPKILVGVSENNTPINLIDRPISQAFLTGNSISDKMAYRRKDGSIIPVSITVSPMMVGSRPVGAIEVFRDITLEHEVDRMKSEFISLASHQLRTPLSAIKTYTHMLLDGFMGPVEPAQLKALKTIISASNRMNELISTLLNITRMETGSIAVAPRLLNLTKIANEVHKELRHAAGEKQINLRLVLPDKPPKVKTDSLIAKEVLTNLMTNAIKYTPEGGTVTLELKVKPTAVVFCVRDTGLGIPAAVHAQIFTKFYRAPNVVARETTGTGLGLYLVKGLVEALGGTIRFDSQENVGTSFYFSLPRQKIKSNHSAAIKVDG